MGMAAINNVLEWAVNAKINMVSGNPHTRLRTESTKSSSAQKVAKTKAILREALMIEMMIELRIKSFSKL